jgi:hypothetical protein
VSIRAEIAPVLLAADPAWLELANRANRTMSVRVTEQLVGAELHQRIAGRGMAAESVWVRVPSWARQARVEVAVTRALWSEFTDLAVTVYDSTGRQLANEPQNYAVGRQVVALDTSRAGRPLLVELMPAWADPAAARAWDVGVRVRFEGDSSIVLGDTAGVHVVAGGRVALPRAAARLPLVPERLDPLVEVVVTAEGEAPAVARGRGGEP